MPGITQYPAAVAFRASCFQQAALSERADLTSGFDRLEQRSNRTSGHSGLPVH